MRPLRVLIAGVGRSPIYEEAFAAALAGRGVAVQRFSWDAYLRGSIGRVQEKWALPGLSIPLLNRALLATASNYLPDVVFIWRGTMIQPDTVKRIRQETGALLVSYNNDDPFSWRHARLPPHHARMWRYFVSSIRYYDVHFVYRKLNAEELLDEGASEVHLLKPYYVPSLHFPMTLTAQERDELRCTAVFAGHFEEDGRADSIRALVAAGIDVKVFGATAWNSHLRGLVRPVVPLEGLAYARALNAADIGLCFLSRLNRDTYTRRCFEIPACGTVLLSERTTDLQAMFTEDREAVYFSTPDELVRKVQWLMSDDMRRRGIATDGRARLLKDGHSVDDRVEEWLTVVESALLRRSA